MRENMSQDKQIAVPENTAVRTALWWSLHIEVDSPPHVFEVEVGIKLVTPDDGWRNRADMSPFTRPFRASIVARARFVEDLVAEQAARGVGQSSSVWAWTPLPSVGRSMHLACSYSRSISPARGTTSRRLDCYLAYAVAADGPFSVR